MTWWKRHKGSIGYILVLTFICVAVITFVSMILGVGVFGGKPKEGFNKENLTMFGFEAVQGSLVCHENVIFVSEPSGFVHLAEDWNVTTIFYQYDCAFFGHDGVIYAYSW